MILVDNILSDAYDPKKTVDSYLLEEVARFMMTRKDLFSDVYLTRSKTGFIHHHHIKPTDPVEMYEDYIQTCAVSAINDGTYVVFTSLSRLAIYWHSPGYGCRSGYNSHVLGVKYSVEGVIRSLIQDSESRLSPKRPTVELA